MREPIQHMRTSHVLMQEWDSNVINPLAWRDSWLDWSMVGAVWSPFLEPGWPACNGHDNCCGNAGFSLRDRRYCQSTYDMLDAFPEDRKMLSCDMTPVLLRRKWMENQGVKFAPWEVGRAFSCENSVYAGEFAVHGCWSIETNNWGGPYYSKRYPKNHK